MNIEKYFKISKFFIVFILIGKIIFIILVIYLVVKLSNNPELVGEFFGKILKGFETAKQ